MDKGPRVGVLEMLELGWKRWWCLPERERQAQGRRMAWPSRTEEV